jgi:hypothetical protein
MIHFDTGTLMVKPRSMECIYRQIANLGLYNAIEKNYCSLGVEEDPYQVPI